MGKTSAYTGKMKPPFNEIRLILRISISVRSVPIPDEREGILK